MVKIAQRERVDVYTIPPNFAQEGTIFSGRVRLRNAFEAGLLALLLLQALLATDLGVKGNGIKTEKEKCAGLYYCTRQRA